MRRINDEFLVNYAFNHLEERLEEEADSILAMEPGNEDGATHEEITHLRVQLGRLWQRVRKDAWIGYAAVRRTDGEPYLDIRTIANSEDLVRMKVAERPEAGTIVKIVRVRLEIVDEE